MKGKGLRIIFMGNPDFAAGVLKYIFEAGYNIVGVVTNPDKPAGRGLKLTPSAVKNYADSVGLHTLQPEKLRDEQFLADMSALNADLAIVVAFKMLPTVVWSMPRLGTFNLHTSLLPDYRGAAPINWAVINGDKRTGVTTFMLDKEIDTGDIIDSRGVDITDNMTAGELHDLLMNVGSELVVDSIELVANGDFKAKPQEDFSNSLQRPAPKIFKDDCRIDWNGDVDSIHNKIRGLSPYPAAWFELRGVSYKLYATHKEHKDIDSSLFGVMESDGSSFIRVGCNGGYIYIDELQPAGKKRMKTVDYLRGNPIK